MIVQFWKRDAFSIAVEPFVLLLLSHVRNLRMGLDNQNTVAPKSFPMIAVAAIASAPQNATLMPPIQGDAPPVRAASAPSATRQTSEVPETTSQRFVSGANTTTSNG